MRSKTDIANKAWNEIYFRYNVLEGQHGTDESQAYRFDRSDVTKVTMVNGWRKPTPYESLEISTRDPDCIYRRDYLATANPQQYRSYAGPAYLVWTPPSQTVRSPSTIKWNACYFAALKKAKDQTINIAVTLAELRESIELVSNRSKLFGELWDLARGKRWRELCQHLNLTNYSFKKGSKDVAGRWMELNFGWMPILSDIHNAIDLIGKKARTDGLMVVARAAIVTNPTVEKFIIPLQVRQKFGLYRNAGLSFYPAPVKGTRTYKEGHKVNLWFRVNNAELQAASALGLTNPASVVWELITLSWFADFFVNVGNWLAALDTLGLEFRGGTQVWWCDAEDIIERFTYDYKTSTIVDSLEGGGGYYSRKQSKRVVVTGTPPPFSLKNPFQVWKALTTVALVRQKF